MCRVVKNVNRPVSTLMFLAENKQGSTPPFSSYTIYKYSFCGLFSFMFISFLYFLWVILLFALASKHSVEGLASVTWAYVQEGCDVPYRRKLLLD